tara:strand:- start:344 stop:541 length:198 start_codon:yes stop_codon:yes gene_type:complete
LVQEALQIIFSIKISTELELFSFKGKKYAGDYSSKTCPLRQKQRSFELTAPQLEEDSACNELYIC